MCKRLLSIFHLLPCFPPQETTFLAFLFGNGTVEKEVRCTKNSNRPLPHNFLRKTPTDPSSGASPARFPTKNTNRSLIRSLSSAFDGLSSGIRGISAAPPHFRSS